MFWGTLTGHISPITICITSDITRSGMLGAPSKSDYSAPIQRQTLRYMARHINMDMESTKVKANTALPFNAEACLQGRRGLQLLLRSAATSQTVAS